MRIMRRIRFVIENITINLDPVMLNSFLLFEDEIVVLSRICIMLWFS